MSFKGLLIHSVGVRTYTPATSDRYGNESPTWGSPTVIQARVSQTPKKKDSQEVLGDRDVTKTWFLVFFQPTVSVHALDHLEWEGRTLEVDGEPLMFYDSRAAHHIQAIAREINE